MTLSLLHRWTKGNSARRGRRAATHRRATTRLHCESLEHRLAPATHTFLGFGGDGNWTTAANWDIGVPDSPDDVLVFPGTTLRPNSTNDFVNASFQRIELEGGITLGGNALTLGSGGLVSEAGLNLVQLPLITAAGQPPINVLAGSTLGISGAISGSGGLTKSGAGRLILSGAGTFAGTTVVSAGVVTVQNAAGLGAAGPDLNGNTQIATGAVVELADDIGTVAEPWVITGGRLRNLAGTNTASGRVAFNITGVFEVNAGSELRVTGPITNGGYTKTGTGRLVLTNANSHSGAITVAQGTLAIENGAALGLASSGTTVQGGASLEVAGNFTTPEPLFLFGPGFSNGGALRSVSGTNAVSGAITLAGDTTIFVDPGSTLTLSGAISGAAGFDLAKAGAGKLVLEGNNTYLGTTLVVGGVLTMASNTALGVSSAGTNVGSGATLELDPNNSNNIPEPLALTGAGTGGAGALRGVGVLTRLTGTVTLNGATTIRVDASDVELNGVVAGPAAATLTKTGVGRLGMRGANTFAGAAFINQGVLQINSNTALGATTAGTAVASGATLESLGATVGEVLTVAGNGVGGTGAIRVFDSTIWNGSITLNSAVVKIDVPSGPIIVNGPVVSGVAGAGIEKTGAGTLGLQANNPYNGTTTLVQGILEINGNQPNSPVVVNSGLLGGGGTIGPLTANGGTVDPGDAVIGCLTVNGDVTLNTGSTFRARLGGTTPCTQFDQLRVTGAVPRTVTLNNPTLAVEVAVTIANGTRLTLVNNLTGGPLVGTFLGIAQGNPPFTVTGVGGAPNQAFRADYTGGNFNDFDIIRNTPPMVEYILLYPEVIYAGEYSYLVGQLTDPDPDDYQGLYIWWGDGSEDQIEYPGLEPFVYYHQYAEPGDYYVFAYWFDLSGEGNFRVLPLTVLPAGSPGGREGAAVASLVANQGTGGQGVSSASTSTPPQVRPAVAALDAYFRRGEGGDEAGAALSWVREQAAEQSEPADWLWSFADVM